MKAQPIQSDIPEDRKAAAKFVDRFIIYNLITIELLTLITYLFKLSWANLNPWPWAILGIAAYIALIVTIVTYIIIPALRNKHP